MDTRLDPIQDPTRTDTDPRDATRIRAYEELKRHLLLGDFPINVRLGEERLAAMLGVSRTPVRSALVHLHAEGLVEKRPTGGFQPTVPQVETMRDLYEVRTGLELQAMGRPRVSGAAHDGDAVAGLRADWQRLAEAAEAGGVDPDPAFVAADETFHVRLAAAAGNHALVELLQQVNERVRVVRMQDFLGAGRIEATIAEHLSILDAVLAGDLDGAEAELRDHLTASLAVVEERVLLAIGRMASRRPA